MAGYGGRISDSRNELLLESWASLSTDGDEVGLCTIKNDSSREDPTSTSRDHNYCTILRLDSRSMQFAG